MAVVLLNHGNAGTQVPGKVIYRHSVISQRHGGVVMPQAVWSTLLNFSGVVQEIESLYEPTKHLAEQPGHVFASYTQHIDTVQFFEEVFEGTCCPNKIHSPQLIEKAHVSLTGNKFWSVCSP